MRIDLVVFDMAGTTVYDGDAVHRCLGEALAAAGFAVTRDQINGVMGIAKPVAIQSLIGSGDEPTLIDSIHSDFLERMIRHYRFGPDIREIEGASEAFLALKSAEVRVALDTGFSRPIADVILRRLGWNRDGIVDASVTSDEVARGRPYPDMIFRAMELCSVAAADRVAKVGDTPSDLQEGTNAGCGYVIGVTGGSHTGDELSAHPHTHLVPSVSDVPRIVLSTER